MHYFVLWVGAELVVMVESRKKIVFSLLFLKILFQRALHVIILTENGLMIYLHQDWPWGGGHVHDRGPKGAKRPLKWCLLAEIGILTPLLPPP